MARLSDVCYYVNVMYFYWHLFWFYAKNEINRIGIFGRRKKYDDISGGIVIDCKVYKNRHNGIKTMEHFYENTNNCFLISFISGITLLGLPTEVYSFGIQYLYVIGGVILMGFIMANVYLPVFHDLNITSTYEVH